jgi:hypothetical protein
MVDLCFSVLCRALAEPITMLNESQLEGSVIQVSLARPFAKKVSSIACLFSASLSELCRFGLLTCELDPAWI